MQTKLWGENAQTPPSSFFFYLYVFLHINNKQNTAKKESAAN